MSTTPALPPSVQPALRVDPQNANHHLWNNNGTWWCHFTVHIGPQKARVRRSLRTPVEAIARARRDALLADVGAALANARAA